MLTEEEYIELIDAITKPIEREQLMHMTVSEARDVNTKEAHRVGQALLEFYKKKLEGTL